MKYSWKFAFLFTLACFLSTFGCGGGGGSQSGGGSNDPVTISPTSATLTVASGQQLQFEAFVQGALTTSVNWLVNNVPGGNSTFGVISSTGLYVVPNNIPSGGITVTAQSTANPSQTASATVSLQYPAATVSSVMPPTIEQGSGATTVTVNGSQFFDGAMVYMAGNPLPTTYISSTQVSALVPQGSLVSPATLLFGAENPAPGGGGSNGTQNGGGLPIYVVAGAYVQVGNVNTARESSAAALVASGKVLVTGGSDNSGNPLSSTEIFDPQSNTFAAAGTMTQARTGHSATTLNSGKVLIAGGNPNPMTAEIYDPSDGSFTATPPMNFPHATNYQSALHQSAAILLNNGQVLLEDWGPGGLQGAPLDAEVYDPTSNTFIIAGSQGVALCFLEDNPPYGGCCLGGGVLGSQNLTYAGGPYYFDPGTLTFTSADPSGHVGEYEGCSVSVLTSVNVFTTPGGVGNLHELANFGTIWNSGTDTTTGVQLQQGRTENSAVVLQSGQVLVLGGRYPMNDEIMNPTLVQSFVAPFPLFTRTNFPTAILLQDGRVLVVGGELINNVVSAVAETYVPPAQ